ncbi:MAG: metallophosphoesterase family protein [Marinoscillum sp.]
MSNPLGQVISKPSGRRLVISDIHGCYSTLQSLISKISLTDNDQLIFLGDYINKGPSSKEVLDYIIRLSSDYNVYPALGNHDKMLLDYLLEPSNPNHSELLKELGNEDFFALSETERKGYIDFLSSLHYYFISGEYILVHAGINFNLSNPFLGKEDMLNIREFYYDSSKAQNKTIVHGHLPYEKRDILERIKTRSKILPIDNGCVYSGERVGMGELLCLNLDTAEIISQQMRDKS